MGQVCLRLLGFQKKDDFRRKGPVQGLFLFVFRLPMHLKKVRSFSYGRKKLYGR